MTLPDLSAQDIFYNDGIKGIAQTQINAQLAYKLFYAFAELTGGDRFLIAYDFRDFSKQMFQVMATAASHANKKLVSLGQIPYDMFQYLNGSGEYDGAIFISPQHGERYWAGFKFFYKQNFEIDYQELKKRIENSDIHFDPNSLIDVTNYETLNIDKDYFFHSLKNLDPLNWTDVKLVVDAGNGLGGYKLRKFLSQIPQIKEFTINSEPNEFFPHHVPNPLVPENNRKLMNKIAKEKAKFGVALDQDGNSLLLIDENGRLINPNITTALLIKILKERDNNLKVGYDIRQSKFLDKVCKESNITGLNLHSSFQKMNRTIRELDLYFASESNGTYYYRDFNYASSNLYTILLIVDHLNSKGLNLSEAVNNLNIDSALSWQMNYLLFTESSWDAIEKTLFDLFPDAIPLKDDGLVLDHEGFKISAGLYRRHYLQVYVEANGDLLLSEVCNKITERLSSLGLYIGAMHEEADPNIIQAKNRDKFELLLNNLWYTWNPHYLLPIIDLYGDGWRKNMPPEAVIANYGKARLNDILQERQWELDQNVRLFNDYFKRQCFFESFAINNPKYEILLKKPIAYFCLEFGLADWLQIYSGGLGILAADFIKQTSDMGIPTVSIGLFYHQGYLHQDFGPDGRQIENYIHQDPMDFNMELIKNPDGSQMTIDLMLEDHIVKVRAWRQKVGVSDLYLLDTNFEDNEEWEDRLITGYLYGGDLENRIRQELVLAVGGMRLLEKLGVEPSICHMNEGHSGFLIFEQTYQIMKRTNLEFDTALNEAKSKLVFTNHTLKSAGNDIFDFLLFERYLTPLANELKVDVSRLFNIGDDKTYSQGGFSMTIFGMRNAKVSNAVSKLHAKAAKKIWPEYDLVPVTNGVHMPTWVSPEIHELLDEYLGENWHFGCNEIDYERIQKIPQEKLWAAHLIRKQKLLHSLNNEMGLQLRDDVLTIAWSRRLAAYKRPDLLINDLERLKRIISNVNRPVQILIAGKSHPKDNIGKEILKRMNQCFNNDEFHNKVEIIPGYNWQLARRMVSGADIWLNTPYRYEEACGTSGMKAAANGVLQFTTKDGWTDEVDWYKIGWVIPEEEPANALYDTLENQIAPLFYNRAENEFNKDWTAMMLNSIQMALKEFSAQRMIKDYLDNVYSHIL